MRSSHSIAGAVLLGILAMTWHFSRNGSLAPADQVVLAVKSDRNAPATRRAGAMKPAQVTPLSQVIPRGGRAFSVQTSVPDYDGDAKAYVEALVPASKSGDAAASYAIYLRVRNCRLAMKPLREDELAIDQSLGIAQQALRTRERELEQCASLIPAQNLVETHWLEIAAEQGSLEARLIYATNPEDVLGDPSQMLAAPEKTMAYRETAIGYLEAALRQGNLDALSILSSAYENGILIGRDPVMSYAHAAALVRADPNPAIADLESIPRQSLNEAQLREGRDMADVIYRQCCVQPEVTSR